METTKAGSPVHSNNLEATRNEYEHNRKYVESRPAPSCIVLQLIHF